MHIGIDLQQFAIVLRLSLTPPNPPRQASCPLLPLLRLHHLQQPSLPCVAKETTGRQVYCFCYSRRAKALVLPWVESQDVAAANIAALQAVCLLLYVDLEVVAVH